MRPLPATSAKSLSDIQILLRLWPFVRPYGWRLLGGVAAVLIGAAAMVSIPQLVRVLVDDALNQRNAASLNYAVLAIMLVVVALVATTYIRAYLLRISGLRISIDLRTALFKHLLSHPVSFFETRPSGELATRLSSDVNEIRMLIANEGPWALRGALLGLGVLSMMFYTSWQLTLTLLLAAPPLIGMAVWRGKLMRTLSRQQQDKRAEIGAHTGEVMSFIRLVQSFAAEGTELKTHQQISQDLQQAGKSEIIAVAGFFSFSVFIGFSALALAGWLGGHMVLAGTLSLGSLMAFFIYLAFLGDAVGSLTGFWTYLQAALGSTERVFELLETRPAITSPAAPKSLPAAARGRGVVFENVSFNYASRPETSALNNISFVAEAGQTIALVGPSGAGKSTLFSLLLRFYDPQQGRILIDGIDLRELPLSSIRTASALVAQEPMIFSSTIAENIRYGKPDATKEEVERAARMAYADEFITQLPQLYETRVGEKGVRLSGGQKQRLAIARTILRNPSILLLDEATSHLDAESERMVQAALGELAGARTTLVIAHRLATVQKADRILVFDKGQLVAQGTHERLLVQSPLYKNLAELQFLGT